MANQWHVKWIKEGKFNWNLRRKRVQFIPDLSGIRFFDLLPSGFREDTRISAKASRYFEEINLSGANLLGADLSDLNFQKADFSFSILRGASLARTNFSHAKFDSADLTVADFRRSTLDGASFKFPILAETQIAEATVVNTLFVAADLQFAIGEFENISSAHSYPNLVAYEIVKSGEVTGLREQKLPKMRTIEVEERTKKDRYEVFYGTNRNPIRNSFENSGQPTDFDGSEAAVVSYGICSVIIPHSKPIGKSSWFKGLLNRSEMKTVVDRIFDLDPELFWSEFKKINFGNAPTIFVHGYNTSFMTAVSTAATIGRDLGVSLAIGLFSWPSTGNWYDYLNDETAVMNSRQALAEYISEFSQKNSSGRINVIAHSMGCRLLSLALEELSASDSGVLQRIDNIILAAADIDQSLFSKIASKFTSAIGRVTSYACDSDIPLMLSASVHRYDRLGNFLRVFSLQAVDSILLNKEQFDILSHDYVSGKRYILNDIYYLLQNKLAPTQRFSLVQEADNVWRMKV